MKQHYQCAKPKRDYKMQEKIKRYFKKLISILKKPEMAILPSNIAFHLILAIIPLLTIVVLIASSFDISVVKVADLVKNFMPSEVSEIIIGAISGKGFDTSIGFFNIIALFLASNGMYALINTSDALYKITERNVIKKRISSIIILFIVVILFVFLLIIPIFGENILNIMYKAKIFSNHKDTILIIFNFLKWPITLLIIYFNIKLIYTVAPSKNISSKETTIGAAFTTIMWTILTIGFRFYLTYFARYDILYGNLSSIIILMVWVYFMSYIFTLGMAINVSRKEDEELEETKRIELEQIKKAKEEIKD